MSLNNGPYSLPFRGPAVLSWGGRQLSFSPFWTLLHHLSRAVILSQKPNSSDRSHVFHSGPIWQLWPPAWPHRHPVFPFTGRGVFLPETSTSFTSLFFMVSLFVALSVMPIPCTLDERIWGQKTWINGVFLFLNISKQHKSVQWVQTQLFSMLAAVSLPSIKSHWKCLLLSLANEECRSFFLVWTHSKTLAWKISLTLDSSEYKNL